MFPGTREQLWQKLRRHEVSVELRHVLVDLPIWPTKFIIVVGMVFFLLQATLNLVLSILAARVLP